MSEPLRLLWPLAAACVLLGACAAPKSPAYQREEFVSDASMYTRTFAASEAQACEAARRALLSQGYVVNTASADLVNARKSFQPEAETHIEIEFRVTCAAEVTGNGKALLFVSALQDRYALKKSNSSASIGVGVLGSVSVPFTGSDDSLVKVASETVTAAAFYDRYFRLVASYLAPRSGEAPADKP